MKRQERQEIKHDRFVETLLSIGEKLQEHQRQIVVVVVILAIMVGAAVWVAMNREATEKDRSARLYTAQREIFKALSSQGMDPDMRADALKRGLTSLRRLYEAAPQSAAGVEALYLIAEVQYSEKNYEKAVTAYRDLLAPASAATPALKKLIRLSLAVALEQGGDCRAAADVYSQRAAETEGELKAAAMLDLARCQELLNEIEDANATRKSVIALAPDTVWAQRADLDIRLAKEPRPAPEKPADASDEAPEKTDETPAEGDAGKAPEAAKTPSEGEKKAEEPVKE